MFVNAEKVKKDILKYHPVPFLRRNTNIVITRLHQSFLIILCQFKRER